MDVDEIVKRLCAAPPARRWTLDVVAQPEAFRRRPAPARAVIRVVSVKSDLKPDISLWYLGTSPNPPPTEVPPPAAISRLTNAPTSVASGSRSRTDAKLPETATPGRLPASRRPLHRAGSWSRHASPAPTTSYQHRQPAIWYVGTPIVALITCFASAAEILSPVRCKTTIGDVMGTRALQGLVQDCHALGRTLGAAF